MAGVHTQKLSNMTHGSHPLQLEVGEVAQECGPAAAIVDAARLQPNGQVPLLGVHDVLFY
jgi:hypothetical protein